MAFFPNDGADAATLLGNADAALYRAKADGRGVFRMFEADMDKRLRERRALAEGPAVGDRCATNCRWTISRRR